MYPTACTLLPVCDMYKWDKPQVSWEFAGIVVKGGQYVAPPCHRSTFVWSVRVGAAKSLLLKLCLLE